jgi:putative thiamine transport system permease protein
LRKPTPRWQGLNLQAPLLLTGYAAIAVLLIWSVADAWFFPSIWPDSLSRRAWIQADWAPFRTTLWLATAVNLICLPVALLWLEWGPKHMNAALYLPLILPALPLVAGQHAALLHLGLDGTALALAWSHLLWVLPYMVLTLVGVYRSVDPRQLTTARALGCSHLGACMRVKWPSLMRPILAALAVGFAVSVAQYLPTLFAGGGRFATVTTEAVALSAGGNRRTLAVQALLQIALPLVAFALAAWLPAWAGRNRRGLR